MRDGGPGRRLLLLLAGLALFFSGCRRHDFPTYPDDYREYAYVSNGGSDTVTVLDLVNMRQERVLNVGHQPTGIAANPVRNEVYVVNTGSASGDGSVSVIDATKNTVTATIPVHRRPYDIDVDPSGQRAYVANSGSNNVSVIDLAARREVAIIGVGEAPGLARIAPDGSALVVTNRTGGSMSIADPRTGRVRSAFNRCPGATDLMILADSSKAFATCSAGHQVMVVALAHPAAANPVPADRLLTLLDVGKTPVHLALKPDGGEAFVSNFESDTISEIATQTNEVGGAYLVGLHPVRGLVSADNSTLWVSNFGANLVGVYSIDDGKLVGSVRVGEGPDALAFAGGGRLLLVVNAQSGDVAAVRTRSRSLFTLLPVGLRPNAIAVKAFRVR